MKFSFRIGRYRSNDLKDMNMNKSFKNFLIDSSLGSLERTFYNSVYKISVKNETEEKSAVGEKKKQNQWRLVRKKKKHFSAFVEKIFSHWIIIEKLRCWSGMKYLPTGSRMWTATAHILLRPILLTPRVAESFALLRDDLDPIFPMIDRYPHRHWTAGKTRLIIIQICDGRKNEWNSETIVIAWVICEDCECHWWFRVRNLGEAYEKQMTKK